MRPEYEPTAEQRALVESASAFGITQAEIATQLRISEPTLRKHFREELDGGAFKANMRVGGNMYGLTQSSDEQVRLRACQWWTARRMGWKAKASRISRPAVKSRYARETGVAGEMITLHGGARSSPRANTVRDHRWDHEMREGRWQTRRRLVDAVSRLKPAAGIDGDRGVKDYNIATAEYRPA
jgi:hypothetical protein